MTRFATPAALVVLMILSPAFGRDPTTLPVDQGKPYVHKSTGMQFPMKVATFERISGHQYDDEAANISFGYRDEARHIMGTVYLYPAGREDLDTHFKRIQREILGYYRDARVLAEGPATVRQGERSYTVRQFVFTYNLQADGRPREVRSETYLALVGKNFIKYRFTYPAAADDAPAKAVGAFTNELALPASN